MDSVARPLARLGYVARGSVYVLLGGLTLAAAVGAGGSTTDTRGVFVAILSQPFGAVLLAAVALGLLCFAAWRVAQSFFDADGLGTGRKALVRRVAFALSALINLGLAISAASIILGLSSGSGGGDGAARDWTAYLLSAPFGRWLVAAVGLAVAGSGLAIGLKGWSGDLDQNLRLDAGKRAWVMPLGRLGYMARGLVFVVVGIFLLLAAIHSNPEEARGLGGALHALQEQPYGWFLFGIVALGLLAFGVFELVAAAYRRIEPPDLAARALHLG